MIQGDIFQWLTIFLIGRKQKVVIDVHSSEYCDVVSGVP